MKFRPYQWEAVSSIWNYFLDGNVGNPLVVMPTGTGKSLVISGFCRLVLEQYFNQRIVVLAHVKELISQNFEKFTRVWPQGSAGIYSSGLKKRELFNNVTFAGIASVSKRAAEFGHVDLIIIDEAHLVSPEDNTMYQKFISELKIYNPRLKVIGLTATPYRLGFGSLVGEEKSLFTDICFDNSKLEDFNQLIRDGYLMPLVPKKTKLLLNVDGVHIQGGDFVAKELQMAVDKYEITLSAIKEAMEEASDRRHWLVFTTGTEHSIHTAEILNELGISAKAIYSSNKTHKMSEDERTQIIADFKAGKFQALVNNNILTTGFDYPEIDVIVVLRPTTSVVLWVQMLGRGTRPVYCDGYDLGSVEGRLQAIEAGPKRDCLVLDFGGNTKRLGPINDPHIPGRKGKGGGVAPVKLCEAVTKENKICNTWVHASLKTCPHCLNEFLIISQSNLKQIAGNDALIKMDLPVVEEFKVDHITYSIHQKDGRPPSLKVSYYCNLRKFDEYIAFEFEGNRKARNWWGQRTEMEYPVSTEQALELADMLSVTTSLRVWTNKKYPEIMAYCFDGTHFGKETVATTVPTVTSEQQNNPFAFSRKVDFEEDDIPF